MILFPKRSHLWHFIPTTFLCIFINIAHAAHVDVTATSSSSDTYSGSESRLESSNSSPDLPIMGMSPRSTTEDKTIIKISSKKDLDNFFTVNDLSKIKQLLISDLNKDSSVSLTNYLHVNAHSLMSLTKIVLKNIVLNEDVVANIVILLNAAKKIKELRFEANQITDDSLKALRKINDDIEIQKLELVGIVFEKQSLKRLKYLFRKLKKLTVLSFRDSEIGNDTGKSLNYLSECLTGLIYLDLSNTGIEYTEAKNFLASTQKLKHLNLSGNRFDSLLLKNIDTFKNTFPNIEHLFLSKCEIHPTSVYQLIELIGKEGKIKTLDLSGNNIGNQGLHLIVINLQRIIEKLFVGHNNLTKESLFYLKDYIAKFQKIKSLDFSENNLQDGVLLLAIIVERSVTLKNINISRSKLDNRDIKMMASNFETFGSLEGLNLEFNEFDEKALQFFRQAQIKNSNLKILTIHSDRIGAEALKKFAEEFSTELKGCRINYTGFVGQV